MDEDLTAESMRMTTYFKEQALRKRPYLKVEWCVAVIRKPTRREVQDDGRIRF